MLHKLHLCDVIPCAIDVFLYWSEYCGVITIDFTDNTKPCNYVPCFLITSPFLHDLNNTSAKSDISHIAGIKVTVIRRINTPRNIYGFITLNASGDKAHNMDIISINIQITITILF